MYFLKNQFVSNIFFVCFHKSFLLLSISNSSFAIGNHILHICYICVLFFLSYNFPENVVIFLFEKNAPFPDSLQFEALRHRIHEAAPQQSKHRSCDRQGRRPNQERNAKTEEEGPRRDRRERHSDLLPARVRLWRRRGIQGTGNRNSCRKSVNFYWNRITRCVNWSRRCRSPCAGPTHCWKCEVGRWGAACTRGGSSRWRIPSTATSSSCARCWSRTCKICKRSRSRCTTRTTGPSGWPRGHLHRNVIRKYCLNFVLFTSYVCVKRQCLY